LAVENKNQGLQSDAKRFADERIPPEAGRRCHEKLLTGPKNKRAVTINVTAFLKITPHI
jgi:hypothetical protein